MWVFSNSRTLIEKIKYCSIPYTFLYPRNKEKPTKKFVELNKILTDFRFVDAVGANLQCIYIPIVKLKEMYSEISNRYIVHDITTGHRIARFAYLDWTGRHFLIMIQS